MSPSQQTRVAGPNQTARDLMSNRPEKALSGTYDLTSILMVAFRFQIIHLCVFGKHFLGHPHMLLSSSMKSSPTEPAGHAALFWGGGLGILKMFIQDFVL